MKVTISETYVDRQVVFPMNSLMFVQTEVANRWSRENKARIIGLSDEEFQKLDEQSRQGEEMELIYRCDSSNYVKGDHEQAREVKIGLGL